MNFKNIHIGQLILQRVKETGFDSKRICSYFKCKENDIVKMYESRSLYPDIIMKWCELLEYDFFRIYSQHLILYAPVSKHKCVKEKSINSTLPHSRKSIYTVEVIEFIMDLIHKGSKTKREIIDEYNIPKATLYKWIQKYDNQDESKKIVNK